MAERQADEGTPGVGVGMGVVDATWLHMDDPTNLMMVSGILYFDRAPEFEKISSGIRA